jgi:hypothetical protein
MGHNEVQMPERLLELKTARRCALVAERAFPKALLGSIWERSADA